MQNTIILKTSIPLQYSEIPTLPDGAFMNGLADFKWEQLSTKKIRGTIVSTFDKEKHARMLLGLQKKIENWAARNNLTIRVQVFLK